MYNPDLTGLSDSKTADSISHANNQSYVRRATVSYSTQKNEAASNRREFTQKVEPSILKGARQIYRNYLDTHASHLPRPLGVAINRTDMSGKLVHKHAIFLPQECFVPIEILESSEHY